MGDISKVQIRENLYNLKDFSARQDISNLTTKVDSLYTATEIEIVNDSIKFGRVINSLGERMEFSVSGSDLIIE